MKSLKYLDAVKSRYDIKRDNELAEKIGCSPSAVSRYYAGKAFMDEEQCLRVAQALGMENPLPIIAAAGMDRAEKTGQRSLWEVFTKATSLSPLAVALLVGVTSIVTSSSADASQTPTYDSSNLYYVNTANRSCRLPATCASLAFSVACHRDSISCRSSPTLPAGNFFLHYRFVAKYSFESSERSFRHVGC